MDNNQLLYGFRFLCRLYRSVRSYDLINVVRMARFLCMNPYRTVRLWLSLIVGMRLDFRAHLCMENRAPPFLEMLLLPAFQSALSSTNACVCALNGLMRDI
jgi:hypothetical protein